MVDFSGILKAPVKLDTSLSVKSTTVIKEEVTVSRDGKIVDERSRETKDHSYYTSAMTEIFEPIKVIPTAELLNEKYNGWSQSRQFPDFLMDAASFCCLGSPNDTFTNASKWSKFGSSSSASSYESEHEPSMSYGVPKQCLSKDSGHMTSSATDKIDFTPSSIDSLSSYDETDYICEQLSKCASFAPTNGYSNGFLVSWIGSRCKKFHCVLFFWLPYRLVSLNIPLYVPLAIVL